MLQSLGVSKNMNGPLRFVVRVMVPFLSAMLSNKGTPSDANDANPVVKSSCILRHRRETATIGDVRDEMS
jgi:hypothetical protein